MPFNLQLTLFHLTSHHSAHLNSLDLRYRYIHRWVGEWLSATHLVNLAIWAWVSVPCHAHGTFVPPHAMEWECLHNKYSSDRGRGEIYIYIQHIHSTFSFRHHLHRQVRTAMEHFPEVPLGCNNPILCKEESISGQEISRSLRLAVTDVSGRSPLHLKILLIPSNHWRRRIRCVTKSRWSTERLLQKNWVC